MRWILLALVACTGCDVIFGLQERDDDPRDAAVVDAPEDGTQPTRCVQPLIEDAFDDGVPCAPWGGPTTTNASLTEANGDLVVTLEPGTSNTAYGACTHATTIAFAGGVALEVIGVVGEGAYIQFNAYADGTGRVDAYMEYREGMLALFTRDSPEFLVRHEYDDAMMRWWRLRPVSGGVIAEYSPDGLNYHFLGNAAGTPPTEVKLHFAAGGNALTSPTTARFGHLRVCDN